jgi:hypothetical protein
MRFLKGLETRLLVVAILGITAYAVLQPLIWVEWVGEAPPKGSYDLSTLIGIMATIMALGLAAFGVVAFQLAERSSERRLEARARELMIDVEVRAARATAKLMNNVSIQAWLRYDDLWRSKDPAHPYSPEIESDPDFQRIVEEALTNAALAVTEIERIPEGRRAAADIQRSYIIYRGSYAYHLGTKRDPADRRKAGEVVKGFAQSESHHRRETYAWVALRLHEPGDPVWAAGISALESVLSKDAPEEWKQEVLKRYRGAFPSPRPAALDAIIESEPPEQAAG